MPNTKKSLAETHPEVAKQWHPTLNGDLTPNGVTKGSTKKVWWKCDKGDDHEWVATINSRTSLLVNCSVCAGRTVVKSNCLATTNPEIAKQWHPTKNGELTPNDVSPKSSKRIWWKCEKGDDHEWKASIAHRSNGTNCPICSGKIVVVSNCLATTNPEIAKQWHPIKNGELTPYDLSPGSNRKVWWKCPEGDDHEWESKIYNRVIGTGCLICSNLKVVKSNMLSTTNPEIAKQWHPTKNGNLTPDDITAGSNEKIWWKCDKGDDHEWVTSITNRRDKKTGCPFCSGKKVSKTNCLSNTHPEIAKQLHPTKNGHYTADKIYSGGTKNWWWKCEKGDDHVWKANLDNRIRQSQGCPFCTLTPQSKQELTITFELMEFFKNIDPKGFKTRLDGRLRAIDIYIPTLNLCIEFDGSYWHKGKRELDKIKSEMLFEEGFKLIRVREEPLKKIYDTDVISKQPYNGKQVTNDILSVIMNIFKLEEKLISKINDYQSRNELQNKKGLDRYIDKILTEKAEKNGNI